jgi:hypothetical protein
VRRFAVLYFDIEGSGMLRQAHTYLVSGDRRRLPETMKF